MSLASDIGLKAKAGLSKLPPAAQAPMGAMLDELIANAPEIADVSKESLITIAALLATGHETDAKRFWITNVASIEERFAQLDADHNDVVKHWTDVEDEWAAFRDISFKVIAAGIPLILANL